MLLFQKQTDTWPLLTVMDHKLLGHVAPSRANLWLSAPMFYFSVFLFSLSSFPTLCRIPTHPPPCQSMIPAQKKNWKKKKKNYTLSWNVLPRYLRSVDCLIRSHAEFGRAGPRPEPSPSKPNNRLLRWEKRCPTAASGFFFQAGVWRSGSIMSPPEPPSPSPKQALCKSELREIRKKKKKKKKPFICLHSLNNEPL
ncbi:uncharacterized protein PgNI_00210, partial [Pyricularia grisea]|uniref:Uncharacterized protein n=1 Tax=Pyricularia grisea TaxID=148305 RepID=A0A6P8BKR7_PYRGI